MSCTLSHKVWVSKVNFLCSSLSVIRNAKFRCEFTNILVQTAQYTKAIDAPLLKVISPVDCRIKSLAFSF